MRQRKTAVPEGKMCASPGCRMPATHVRHKVARNGSRMQVLACDNCWNRTKGGVFARRTYGL